VNGTGAAAGATAAGATTAAATAATAAAGTTSAGAAQSVQSFLHALFQALKADGLGPAGTSSAATAAGSAAASTGSAGATESGAGRYAGSLVSSLETLIQQVGGTGATSATAANLSASFNNLIANVGGTTAASGNGTSPTSTASLQSFLSGLLQDARNGGGPSRSSLGATVNANV
jgi:hypothetical protein